MRRKQYIGQLELLATIGVYYSIPELRGRRVVHWIDNTSAIAAGVGDAKRPAVPQVLEVLGQVHGVVQLRANAVASLLLDRLQPLGREAVVAGALLLRLLHARILFHDLVPRPRKLTRLTWWPRDSHKGAMCISSAGATPGGATLR